MGRYPSRYCTGFIPASAVVARNRLSYESHKTYRTYGTYQDAPYANNLNRNTFIRMAS
jgi:hypothetical protein